MALALCRDALLQLRDGAWLLSNPRVRHHVELDAAALGALVRCAPGADDAAWGLALREASGWDRTRFGGADGLWADQTGIGPRGALARGGELLALLRRRFFVLDPQADAYAAFLAPLESVLDRAHLGRYHERVGQHVLVDRRQPNDWRWWHDQKFTADGTRLLDGPYRDVEAFFFDDYFRGAVAGQRILDFGCGNGHFAARFAAFGAGVTGIDTSPELIALARTNHGDVGEFLAAEDSTAALRLLDAREPHSFDRVYFGDIVLLLLEDPAEFDRLAQRLRELLRADGVIHTMEPNAVFWLAGRYGDPERPYAVVPEYRRPLYNVAQTVDRVVAAFARHGFALTELLHPAAAPTAAPALRAFAAEFPLWDFCTFVLR